MHVPGCSRNGENERDIGQSGAKWSKVKKRKNRVCRERNLVNNYEDKMDNR